MQDLNLITLTGYLAHLPELRKAASGTSVASFTLQCTLDHRKKSEADYANVFSIPAVAFGLEADQLATYSQEDRILVHGRLKTDRWYGDANGGSRLVLVANLVQTVVTTKIDAAQNGAASNDTEDFNSLTIAGRLVRVPNLRFADGGIPMASFVVAANHRYAVEGQWKEQSAFVPVSVGGPQAEKIGSLPKGTPILVIGKLQTDDSQSSAAKNPSLLLAARHVFQRKSTPVLSLRGEQAGEPVPF
jgi:single-stranded DNA-binding protein